MRDGTNSLRYRNRNYPYLNCFHYKNLNWKTIDGSAWAWKLYHNRIKSHRYSLSFSMEWLLTWYLFNTYSDRYISDTMFYINCPFGSPWVYFISPFTLPGFRNGDAQSPLLLGAGRWIGRNSSEGVQKVQTCEAKRSKDWDVTCSGKDKLTCHMVYRKAAKRVKSKRSYHKEIQFNCEKLWMLTYYCNHFTICTEISI